MIFLQMGHYTAKQMFGIKGKIVRNQESSGIGPFIRPNAHNVPGIGITKHVLAEFGYYGGIYVNEQAVVCRHVCAQNTSAKF
jgi:hypothetical protein